MTFRRDTDRWCVVMREVTRLLLTLTTKLETSRAFHKSVTSQLVHSVSTNPLHVCSHSTVSSWVQCPESSFLLVVKDHNQTENHDPAGNLHYTPITPRSP